MQEKTFYLWVNSCYILIHSFWIITPLSSLHTAHNHFYYRKPENFFFFFFSLSFWLFFFKELAFLSSFSKDYFAGLLLETEVIYSQAQRIKIFCNSTTEHHSTYMMEDSGHSFMAEFFTALVRGEAKHLQMPYRQNNLYHTHSYIFFFF